jgi:hypothetical protein
VKKLLTIITTMVLAATMASPAGADPGHRGPKITVSKFLQPPLKAGVNEILKVVAHDPDSWISEVQVQFEDTNGSGGVVFAHTGCVQDPDYSNPGTPAKLRIPIQFPAPGSYHVDIRAISSINCTGESSQTSKTFQKDVVVTEAFESMSDADDSPGPLDIAAIEQTQEGSETSISTEIVHRIKTFEEFSDMDLAGPARIELGFDLDNKAETIERILVIDLDERDSTVRASMLDATTGESRGYAAVFRPDDSTLEVRFPPTLLNEGAHNYQWYAFTDAGETTDCPIESPCFDRAPDTTLMRHRL